ncbi:adenylate/guanylate cyclase domain-containing protein [Microlunatus parietis]|uniref:Class 3 adenylate cyclase n=1 Tax=Microlunatus parietis TaxID=682979 RepID=A0A7Y9IAD9_9ACTN|nr:adenylate/guanylate cyclase domain-containing protein [Microlunatus parietis]NYE72936.1 class 3 adenylate cyclase [Microlunatus parietis]
MINNDAPEVGRYDPDAGYARIGVILHEDPIEESAETLPPRLHGPGAVVSGTVLVVDVRDSSGLARKYPAIHLARLYRALASELTAILTSPQVRHLSFHGDRLWAIYDTPTGADASAVLDLAARANTVRWMINRQLQYPNENLMIGYGIGIEYGRLIMINTDLDPAATGGNLAYAGPTLHRAAELAHRADRFDRLPIDVGVGFAGRVDDRGGRILTEVFQRDPDDQGCNGNLIDHALYEAGTTGERDSGPA